MSTPYLEIYTKFNILMEDSKLLSLLTDDEYTSLQELFLSKAKSIHFKNCRTDLTDVDDTKKQFNQTLSDEEQWILAMAMRLVWVERQLYKEKQLNDHLGTKDYTIHSPGNLLDKLITLKDETKRELKSQINDYSFNNFEGFN